MDEELKNFMQGMRNLQDEINKAGMGSPIEKLKLENAQLTAKCGALAKKLEVAKTAINKALSVFEEDNGVTITTIWEILQDALTEIEKKQQDDVSS